ncbi:hypothetical protein V6N13_005976 [Hibiscus sabdariffa]|uniref:Uncharacterized protein n=1 Tax=Hibiscus sabdariffa TaxID=183260 RepID=A0ABR2EP58_9ROSI
MAISSTCNSSSNSTAVDVRLKKMNSSGKLPVGDDDAINVEGISSDSSSELSRSNDPTSRDKCKRLVEDEAINFVCMGKLLKEGASIYDNNVGRFIGETEILGCCINYSLAVEAVIQDVNTGMDTNGVSQVLEHESYAFNGIFGSNKHFGDQIEAGPIRNASWADSVAMLNNISYSGFEEGRANVRTLITFEEPTKSK